MLAAEASPEGDHLSVTFDGESPVRLHPLWLRDACSCVGCRVPATNERLLNSRLLHDDLAVCGTVIEGPSLLLAMSDHHEVRIDVDWLRQHLGAGTDPTRPAGDSRLWPRADSCDIERFERDDLDDPAGLVAWIDAICRDGAALIAGVDPDECGLRSVAAAVGPILATNYGVTWEISATVEPVSAVESERHLKVHTDLPYRSNPPGLQLLLAAIADVEGGASTLVDGYAAAEDLRQSDPAAWELLTQTEFTYPYVRDGVEIHGRAPSIGVGRDGASQVIRRAPDLVGVPTVSHDETSALYRALGRWDALLDDPAREWQGRLEPGDLLAFDNHRLLHGRTAFELGTSGRRRLLGCYLDLDDLRSRRAVAARVRLHDESRGSDGSSPEPAARFGTAVGSVSWRRDLV